MPLQSAFLKGNIRLERALTIDAAHVALNEVGDHVTKIQQCLLLLDAAPIAAADITGKRYGRSTADAVLGYKTRRRIINTSYQSAADNIVGKMTIAAMDGEMLARERDPPPAPDPARRFARFLAASHGGERPLAVTSAVHGGFAPIGPSVAGNGFDPDPNRDNNASRPNETFQMVPTVGTRSVFIVDPGLAAGTPIFSMRLRSFSGAAPLDHIVTLTEGTPRGTSNREMKLTGQGTPGSAVLEAINVTNGQVEATLQIAVLAKQGFKLGFVNFKDTVDQTPVSGSPAQWLEPTNRVWTSQANLELSSVGAAAFQFDRPFDTGVLNLKAFAPTLFNVGKTLVGQADRYVVFVKDIVGFAPGDVVFGFTDDVIYLSKKVTRAEHFILAHEFGHSIGRSHGEAASNAFNLMFDDVRINTRQGDLNKSQIVQSNLHPGTFKDVK